MRLNALMKGNRLVTKGLAAILCATLAVPLPALAAPGDTLQTPNVPMELPLEVEIELSPAGSLKQAALWKELVQLLYEPDDIVCPPDDPATELLDESQNCTATTPRRPSFTGTPLPSLNVYALNYNFLTGQPMRLRTSDGEISWDQPGPLFDPAEPVAIIGPAGHRAGGQRYEYQTARAARLLPGGSASARLDPARRGGAHRVEGGQPVREAGE